jgi:hypothetical protein
VAVGDLLRFKSYVLEASVLQDQQQQGQQDELSAEQAVVPKAGSGAADKVSRDVLSSLGAWGGSFSCLGVSRQGPGSQLRSGCAATVHAVDL